MTTLFRTCVLLLALVGSALTIGCSDNAVEPQRPQPKSVQFDFIADTDGWVAGFADYPAGDETFYELDSGLTPDTEYAIEFEVEFASNASLECVRVGGPPGLGVTVKAGATAAEPKPEMDASGDYRMNIDKGNQSTGGADAIVLGNVGIDVPCDNAPYQLKTLSNAVGTFTATTDEQGRLWLMVGTDSRFEATTTLYYTRIGADFEPR